MYYLSSTPDLDDGPFCVAPAPFLFKNWDSKNSYLHKVSYTEADVISENEDAHRDGVSNVTFDLNWTVKQIEINETWNLTDWDSVEALLQTSFPDEVRHSLLSTIDFEAALFHLLSKDKHRQLIKALGIESSEASKYRKYPKIRQLIDQHGLVKNFYSLKHGSLSLDEILKDGLPARSEVRSQLAVEAIELGEEYRRCLRKDDSLMVRVSLVLHYIDVNNFEVVERLLTTGRTVLMGSRNLHLLVDRLYVFGKLVWLPLPIEDFSERILATREALGEECEDSSEWQLSMEIDDLEEAVRCGLLRQVKRCLQEEGSDWVQINLTYRKAIEKGYAGIAKLLSQQGFDLSRWGQSAMNWANHYGYSHLKAYLLAEGVSEEEIQN